MTRLIKTVGRFVFLKPNRLWVYLSGGLDALNNFFGPLGYRKHWPKPEVLLTFSEIHRDNIPLEAQPSYKVSIPVPCKRSKISLRLILASNNFFFLFFCFLAATESLLNGSLHYKYIYSISLVWRGLYGRRVIKIHISAPLKTSLEIAFKFTKRDSFSAGFLWDETKSKKANAEREK